MPDLKGFVFKDGALELDDYSLNITGTPTVLNAAGSGSSGTASCCMPLQGSLFKVVVVYLNNFRHVTGTLEYVFPTPFSATPHVIDPTSLGATITATKITFPTGMASAKTGWLILLGN